MITKKTGLIVIAVLLALATLTEAREPVGTFKIGTRYPDGSPFEPDTDILWLDESLYLSIYTDEGFHYGSTFGYFWALVCEPSLATITGGEAGPDAPSVDFLGSPVGHLYGVPGDGQWGWIDTLEVDLFFDPGLYMDNFLYSPSPQSVSDVTVSFWEVSEAGGAYGIVDSIVINQVPEPVTIALLALGGLFLRRRRSCSK